MNDDLMRLSEAATTVSMSKSTFRDFVKRHGFPVPVPTGSQNEYRRVEVEALARAIPESFSNATAAQAARQAASGHDGKLMAALTAGDFTEADEALWKLVEIRDAERAYSALRHNILAERRRVGPRSGHLYNLVAFAHDWVGRACKMIPRGPSHGVVVTVDALGRGIDLRSLDLLLLEAHLLQWSYTPLRVPAGLIDGIPDLIAGRRVVARLIVGDHDDNVRDLAGETIPNAVSQTATAVTEATGSRGRWAQYKRADEGAWHLSDDPHMAALELAGQESGRADLRLSSQIPV